MALIGDTSDLDRFEFACEPILPEKDSYSISLPDGTVVSDLPGGMTKQQLQFFNQAYTVNVTYVGLDAFKIDFIEGFLLRNSGQKFIASLAISDSIIDEYVVQYFGSPNIAKTGFNGQVTLSLQVEPAIDVCFQQFIRDYGETVGNPTEIINDTDAAVRAWVS